MVKQLYCPSKRIFRERSTFVRHSKKTYIKKDIASKWTPTINFEENSIKIDKTLNIRLQKPHQTIFHNSISKSVSSGLRHAKYAGPKFIAPPEPSCVPLPPLHWRQQPIVSNNYLQMSLYLKNILQVK